MDNDNKNFFKYLFKNIILLNNMLDKFSIFKDVEIENIVNDIDDFSFDIILNMIKFDDVISKEVIDTFDNEEIRRNYQNILSKCNNSCIL